MCIFGRYEVHMPTFCARPLLAAGAHRLAVATVLLTAGACTAIEYEDHWMDSPLTADPSLSDPSFLVSTRTPAPTEADLDTPVIVAVHGFGASTYEWVELRDYAEQRGVYVSLVLLGGHGRDLDVWVGTDENDWAEPILAELRALDALGYRHVSVAGSSTGGTLLVRALLHQALDGLRPPEQLMLVAPFIESLDKRLYVAPFIGPVLNNVPGNNTRDERELFYYNRPAPVFYPLMDLLNEVAGALRGPGVALPSGTRMTVWLGDDPIVSPQSATLLLEGVRGDHPVDFIAVTSDLHVHTRGIARARVPEDAVQKDENGEPRVWGAEDDEAQVETFDQIIALARGGQP
jgi:carboxylesterase